MHHLIHCLYSQKFHHLIKKEDKFYLQNVHQMQTCAILQMLSHLNTIWRWEVTLYNDRTTLIVDIDVPQKYHIGYKRVTKLVRIQKFLKQCSEEACFHFLSCNFFDARISFCRSTPYRLFWTKGWSSRSKMDLWWSLCTSDHRIRPIRIVVWPNIKIINYMKYIFYGCPFSPLVPRWLLEWKVRCTGSNLSKIPELMKRAPWNLSVWEKFDRTLLEFFPGT